jgi:hypothetical protein
VSPDLISSPAGELEQAPLPAVSTFPSPVGRVHAWAQEKPEGESVPWLQDRESTLGKKPSAQSVTQVPPLGMVAVGPMLLQAPFAVVATFEGLLGLEQERGPQVKEVAGESTPSEQVNVGTFGS